LKSGGEVVCDIPVPPLVAEAPEYERPWVPTPPSPLLSATDALTGIDTTPIIALAGLIASPDLCSRRWVWEQYDHMVMGDTVRRPGGDAAVVRVHGTDRALAITTDCTPRYCVADPVEGGRQAVAEAWRNLTATGATPLAVTDNMNFGNPERPEIMGQFAGCIEGMAEACIALDFPVVSGNVSLYNETNGAGILPTPAIGGVGLIEDVRSQIVSSGFAAKGQTIVLIGDTVGHLGRSLLMRLLAGSDEGAPPPVDLAAERRNGDFVRNLITSGEISACHDISDGGLLIAIAEMALSGGIGADISVPDSGIPTLAWLFGEDQARYLITTISPDTLLAGAADAGVPATMIGITGSAVLTVGDGNSISLSDLRNAHENWLPEYMAAGNI
jgi:phosphoribosylformylglycinamidine synthase II